MDEDERCVIYNETIKSMKKLLNKGQTMDKNLCMNQLVLVKKDVASNNEKIRSTAIEVIDFLLTLKLQDINIEVIKVVNNNLESKDLHHCILNHVTNNLVEFLVDTNTADFINELKIWSKLNSKKLKIILTDVFLKKLTIDQSKNFLINFVIPLMMSDTTNSDIRNILIDISLLLCTVVRVSNLSKVEYNKLQENINTKYIKLIGELRDKEYANWHNMWIFLVRFHDKILHKSLELINKLLRIVEHAFRSSAYHQKLKGYDCWKELIDNASLDMTHMCSQNKIKLFLTPLKAKFSKQDAVICKRFDVFAYLLKKLQQNAVLCLPEFLEFCFGPIGDHKDASKARQGKSIPQLWSKSAMVLVEVLGHSHDESAECLNIESVFGFKKPLINTSNFPKFYNIITHSVGECCSVLYKADINCKKELVKCLWTSLLNLVIPASQVDRTKYFQPISELLDNYLKLCSGNVYFEDLLVTIFVVLMSYEKSVLYNVISYVVKQLLVVLFTCNLSLTNVSETFKEVLAYSFSHSMLIDTKDRMTTEIVSSFSRLVPLKENVPHIFKVWLCLSDELICDTNIKEKEKIDGFNEFFIWPVCRLKNLDNPDKKDIMQNWEKLYKKVVLNTEEKKLYVLKEIQKIEKEDLISEALPILNLMLQNETNVSKKKIDFDSFHNHLNFESTLVSVVKQILTSPSLDQNDEELVIKIFVRHVWLNFECFEAECLNDIFTVICDKVKNLITHGKGFRLLSLLSDFIKDSKGLKRKFSDSLLDFLKECQKKETDESNKKEIAKILAELDDGMGKSDKKPSVFIPPSSRAGLIAKMAKNCPTSPKLKVIVEKGFDSSPRASSPACLRLFGKDPDTLTPYKVKGSQLNNATPKSSRKIANAVTFSPKSPPKRSLIDESSSEFVVVNTEVKLQPERLSEHQREVMKKRREDIPALYQDLSQSISQDVLGSKSNSNSNFKEPSNEIPNKKVMVEVTKDFVPSECIVENSSEALLEIPPKFKKEIESLEVESKPLDVKETKIEIKSDSDMFREESLLAKAIDPEETIYENAEKPEETKKKQEEGNNSIVDFQTVKPPAKLKKHKSGCSKASPSEINSPGHSQNSDIGKPREEVPRKVDKKKKLSLELTKLKMDIVGAEEFATPDRRSRRLKKNFDEEGKREASEINLNKGRKSLGVEKAEKAPESNRRKSTGVVEVINNDNKQRTTMDITFNNSKKSGKIIRKNSKENLNETTEDQNNEENKLKQFSETRNADVVMVEDKINEQQPENKRGEKRKRAMSFSDDESEDIIESSQESTNDSTRFAVSKLKTQKINPTEKLEQIPEENVSETVVQQKTVTPSDFALNPVDKGKENDVAETELSEKNNLGDEKKLSGEEVDENDKEKTKTVKGEKILELETTHDPIMDKVANDAGMEFNTTQDTTITDNSEDTTQSRQDLNDIDNNEADTETFRMQTQDTETQESPTESELLSEDLRPPVLYFDLPKKPVLTDSERMMCRMDTMSICGDSPNLISNELSESEKEKTKVKNGDIFTEELSELSEKEVDKDVLETEKSFRTETPEKTPGTLPSSPVTVETPTRTSELFDNTLDISPISSQNSSEEENAHNPGSVCLNFDFKPIEELGETEEPLPNQAESKARFHEDKENNSESEKNIEENVVAQQEDGKKESGGIQARDSKLLGVVNVSSPATLRMFAKRRTGTTMSPTLGRIKRLMSNIYSSPQKEGCMGGELREEDFLTFSREVPSPLALPRTGILKRKLSDSTDPDGVSPCPKRKRVNFSDPCLTSSKIFIKDDYYSHRPVIETKCLFDDSPESEDDQLENILDKDGESEKFTESELIETEPSLEISNQLILQREKPIYQNLIDCTDEVTVIMKKVTSPMFVTALLEKMRNKGIYTIGDLAKLSEQEIIRFPFKVPIVATVYKALDNFYKKNYEKLSAENGEQVKVNGALTEKSKASDARGSSNHPNNFLKEFKDLLSRCRSMKFSVTNFLTLILDNINQSEAVSKVKNHYKLSVEDVLETKDYKVAFKHSAEAIGLANAFEILIKESRNSDNEVFDLLSKLVNKPHLDMIQNGTVVTIKQTIDECILRNKFGKKDLIKTCFIPLINGPSDLFGYVSKISIVQIAEIVIQRVHSSDLQEFLSEILRIYPRTEVRESFEKALEETGRSSVDDVVNSFKNDIELKNEEDQTKIMTDVFDFIGDKLDANTLIDLHIALLGKIKLKINK